MNNDHFKYFQDELPFFTSVHRARAHSRWWDRLNRAEQKLESFLKDPITATTPANRFVGEIPSDLKQKQKSLPGILYPIQVSAGAGARIVWDGGIDYVSLCEFKFGAGAIRGRRSFSLSADDIRKLDLFILGPTRWGLGSFPIAVNRKLLLQLLLRRNTPETNRKAHPATKEIARRLRSGSRPRLSLCTTDGRHDFVVSLDLSDKDPRAEVAWQQLMRIKRIKADIQLKLAVAMSTSYLPPNPTTVSDAKPQAPRKICFQISAAECRNDVVQLESLLGQYQFTTKKLAAVLAKAVERNHPNAVWTIAMSESVQRDPSFCLGFALEMAMEMNRTQCAERLIRAGAPVEWRLPTALHVAAVHKNPDIIKLLVRAGADVERSIKISIHRNLIPKPEPFLSICEVVAVYPSAAHWKPAVREWLEYFSHLLNSQPAKEELVEVHRRLMKIAKEFQVEHTPTAEMTALLL